MKKINTILLFVILVICIFQLILSLSNFKMISNENKLTHNEIRPSITIIEEYEK